MKRIFMASLLALTVALGAVATGCSGSDNSSSSTDKASSKVESVNDSSADDSGTAEGGNSVDGDFVWDKNSCIVNLSKEAAKKSEIVIPENCIDLRIDDWASGEDNYFSENDNLESVVFESENIKNLPDGLFVHDKNLKTVQLPKNLKRISEFCFSNCESLETIEIPDKVTEIKESAFQYSGIKEIKLPESVTTVGDSVFAWTKLETLYLLKSLTSIESSFLTCVDSDKLTIYVKKGSYADEHFADFADKTNVEKAYY